MKKFVLILLIVIAVIFFGTVPISILAKIFDYIAIALRWLANVINIFGWKGIV